MQRLNIRTGGKREWRARRRGCQSLTITRPACSAYVRALPTLTDGSLSTALCHLAQEADAQSFFASKFAGSHG